MGPSSRTKLLHAGTWRWIGGALLTISAIGLWLLAIWSNFRGHVPAWAMFVLAPTLLACLVLYGLWHRRRCREEIEANDELAPWRELRLIRNLQLRADSPETTTLILELASESDPTTTAATLRFAGVSRLRMLQYGPYPMHFHGLRSRRLRRPTRDAGALAVVDVHDRLLGFHCASFAELSREPADGESTAADAAAGSTRRAR